MTARRFHNALLAMVAITAMASLAGLRARDFYEPLSVTRVNNLEITGTTLAVGEVTAQAGVRLTTLTTGPIVTSGVGDPNGAVTATAGSLYVRTDSPVTLYQNKTGSTIWENQQTSSEYWDTGSDGTIVFDGVSMVLGFTPVASVYTVTRQFYPENMTVDNGVTVITPCGVFASGTLTLTGTAAIRNDGGAASGAVAGIASLSCTSGGLNGIAGGAGGGAGAGGTAGADPGQTSIGGRGISTSSSNNGGAAGNPGTAGNTPTRGGGGGGGASANAGGQSGRIGSVATIGALSVIIRQRQNNSSSQYQSGTGGGGGGGGVNGTGGGGGGGGGWMVVAAKELAGAGSITSAGGAGADGTDTGGGGGGGGGGIVIVLYGVKTGTTTITAAGGAAGAATGTGFAGGAGADGVVITKQFN
jgi:hypothetical protein